MWICSAVDRLTTWRCRVKDEQREKAREEAQAKALSHTISIRNPLLPHQNPHRRHILRKIPLASSIRQIPRIPHLPLHKSRPIVPILLHIQPHPTTSHTPHTHGHPLPHIRQIPTSNTSAPRIPFKIDSAEEAAYWFWPVVAIGTVGPGDGEAGGIVDILTQENHVGLEVTLRFRGRDLRRSVCVADIPRGGVELGYGVVFCC